MLGGKSWHINQGSQCKKIESKPKKKKKSAYFWGHPVIQAVKAKRLGIFNKIIIFLQNISSQKKSAITLYEL